MKASSTVLNGGVRRRALLQQVTRLAPTHQGGGQPALLSLADARLSAVVLRLPERTWLFRLLTTHQDWTRAFLAAPTVLGVDDTHGIELIHPA